MIVTEGHSIYRPVESFGGLNRGWSWTVAEVTALPAPIYAQQILPSIVGVTLRPTLTAESFVETLRAETILPTLDAESVIETLRGETIQ